VTEYVLRRLLQSVLVLFGVITVVFFILRLTGDPVRLMIAETASEEDVQNIRRNLGLDRPLHEQYLTYIGNVARLEFGESLRQRGQGAMKLVLDRYPATLRLAAAALGISVLLAFALGMISAIRRYSIVDNVVMVIALFGQCVPNFWLGLMLILIFAVIQPSLFGLTIALPSQGYGDGNLRYLILPAVTLAAPGLARLTRLVRSGMLDVLGEDYLRTARAKGLGDRQVILGHALKNAAIPLVTVIGLDVGVLLGGAVITETIFVWPGVGALAIESINGRDFPVVQAAVFLIAATFVLVNLLVDLLYTWLDPRIRLR
jgi:peptide/nickel transport system permease protein